MKIVFKKRFRQLYDGGKLEHITNVVGANFDWLMGALESGSYDQNEGAPVSQIILDGKQCAVYAAGKYYVVQNEYKPDMYNDWTQSIIYRTKTVCN